uniref:DUF4939 domain-containing protein n=1 Tax=Sphaeramia orbicularis TaxID=375764 RepID=A0A673A0W1_9TELE
MGGHEQLLHEPEPSDPSVRATEEPNIPPPSKYSGNPDTCRSFCTQIRLIFDSQPRRFSCESAKIAYVASLLEGPPLSFFNSLMEQNSPLAHEFRSLAAESGWNEAGLI